MDWTREEQLVASELANAARAGKSITGAKIEAITGLPGKTVYDALRKLGTAGLIHPKEKTE